MVAAANISLPDSPLYNAHEASRPLVECAPTLGAAAGLCFCKPEIASTIQWEPEARLSWHTKTSLATGEPSGSETGPAGTPSTQLGEMQTIACSAMAALVHPFPGACCGPLLKRAEDGQDARDAEIHFHICSTTRGCSLYSLTQNPACREGLDTSSSGPEHGWLWQRVAAQ